MASKVFVTPAEYADMSGLPATRVRELCRQQGCPAGKLGRRWLIPPDAMTEWLLSQRPDANSATHKAR